MSTRKRKPRVRRLKARTTAPSIFCRYCKKVVPTLDSRSRAQVVIDQVMPEYCATLKSWSIGHGFCLACAGAQPE